MTHWKHCGALAARYRRARIEPDPIFVRDGPVWSSAGVTAGIDLALALVEEDLGRATALVVARHLVMFLKRPGGQAQFIVRPAARAAETGLGAVLAWLEAHACEDLALADVAARAGLSARTLNRRFHEETGRTPMQWVTAVRIRRAQEVLERTDHGVDRIAHLVGVASPAHFRVQFKRHSGVTPQAYRTTFRGLRTV